MVREGNIVLRPTIPGTPVLLAPGLEATPVLVPHRAEFSDTVAYHVQGRHKLKSVIP
jgi:pyrroloquinoline quinone biosynthesis protein B